MTEFLLSFELVALLLALSLGKWLLVGIGCLWFFLMLTSGEGREF